MALSGVLAALLPWAAGLLVGILLVGILRRHTQPPHPDRAVADLHELEAAGILTREQVAQARGELERSARL